MLMKNQETFKQFDDSYKFGFVTDIESDRAKKGLNEGTIEYISKKKKEPEWMLEWRLKAFEKWKRRSLNGEKNGCLYCA